jgi:DNA-binding NtrC family response regulator
METRRFRRVGDTEWRDTDFRLICATNKDLADMVQAGTFREDLYYRLAVFEIELPPLRERRADLAPLCEAILERLDRGEVTVAEEAMEVLDACDFPGNVRQLRNVLERATLLIDGQVIEPRHLPDSLRSDEAGAGSRPESAQSLAGSDGFQWLTLAEAEDRYLREALRHHTGDRRSLAAALGISERALYRKLARLEGP